MNGTHGSPTPIYGFPSPELDDDAHGPEQIFALAQAVEAVLTVGPLRMSGGVIEAAEPTAPNHPVTLEYLNARKMPWTRMITGAQSLPNGTTWRAASAGTVIGPLAGQWSGGVFTFPEPGVWLVTAEVTYRPQGSPSAIDTQFRLTVGGGVRHASGRVPANTPVDTGISLVSLHTSVAAGTTSLSGAHWHSHNTALEVTSTIIHIVRISEV